MDSNESRFDPNEPDCTNGDFFCRLCLSSQNSESMWSSHIAGKRHIKNAQKFPSGLPTRDYVPDEDSYERPPKRERFDDGYDMHDDFPKPEYEDEYYYNQRPPMDYTPVIKPNIVIDYTPVSKPKIVMDYTPVSKPKIVMDYTPVIKPDIVIDYGHTKKLQAPPPEMNKPSASSGPPPILPVTRPPPADSPVDIRSVLDHLLPKSNEQQSQVKDDFFEKINQREIAKEIAKEIVKKGISLDNIESALSGKKKDDHKSQSDTSRDSRHDTSRDSRQDSPRDSRQDSSRDSRQDSSRDSRRDSRRDPPRETRRDPPRETRRDPPRETRRDPPRETRRDSRRDYDKHDKRAPDVFELLQKNKDKKKFRFDDEKDSKEKKSSSMKSSAKSKSIIDDLDPDELTPDVLDSLLSARLKPKKPENSDEICNKKHCMKNEVDLDDPKVIAQKLESLSTMEFLKIIHKKLVNVDLKSPEELKMLLKVISEAQVAVCEKLPPELQALVKAKLSMNDGSNLPAQQTQISQNQPVASITTSSNAVSQNSFATVPSSSKTTISVNTIPTLVSTQTPAVQYKPLVPPPMLNIPVSLNQSSVSNAFPPNQTPLSYASSVMSNTPTVTPAQLTAAPVPLTNVASVNNPPSLQNLQSNSIHNYYNTIFSMYQNRPLAPPTAPVMYSNQRPPLIANQALPVLARFPPPPPPPPIPAVIRQIPPTTQLSKEVLDAIVKIRSQQAVKQPKQDSPGSRDSPPKTKEEILLALKNLDVLQEEYKRKKLLKSRNESRSNTSEKSKSNSSGKR